MKTLIPSTIQKPKQEWGDVSSLLHGMAITTFDVDPQKLSRLLPQPFKPQCVTLKDGRIRALVSSVTFRNTGFFVRFAPFIKLECHQTNYRAYVQYNGKACAWFFHTTLESFWTFIPKHIWGLPWSRSQNTFHFQWDNASCTSYQWTSHSSIGKETLIARGTRQPQHILDGFESAYECWSLLTHPFDGYLYLRNKNIGHYSVWHQPLRMERAQAEEVSFPLWEELGLIKVGQEPHSILLQEKIHYLIFLPPKRITVDNNSYP